MTYPTRLPNKLPGVGTTIFSVMTARANLHGAVNLAQGFPNIRPDEDLFRRVHDHMLLGHNQYAPMPGWPKLLTQVAGHLQRIYGIDVEAETELTIVSGATEGLFAACAAFLNPGDEVLVLEPAYDSYVPAIVLNGAVPVPVPLSPATFAPDWQAIAQAIGPRTVAIFVNQPHNPTGTVWTAADIGQLQDLAARHNLLVVADEVYYEMVFDGRSPCSVLQWPQLRQQSVVVGSFGKSLHITGWKLGWVCAPRLLTAELRKVHQYITFSSSTPMQAGIADYLEAKPGYALELAELYEQKRNEMLDLLQSSPLRPLPQLCQGTYFLLADYSEWQPGMDDLEFAYWLNDEVGVAVIPLSPFYSDGLSRRGLVRICFAKTAETLQQAAHRLQTTGAIGK